VSANHPRQFDVVVVGDLNADLILTGDVIPQFGQVEKLIDDANLTIGGSSAITACGAARLGLRVGMIGKVGQDVFGDFLRQALAEQGVDTSGVIVDPAIKTGLTVHLSRDDDRAMLTFSGTLGALRYAEIDQTLLQRAQHLHMGSYFMLDSLRPDVPALLAAARAAGLTVSLDTNYDPAETWDGGLADALGQVDVFLPNETELCAITRQPDVVAGLSQLAVPLVAVKSGAAGARARFANQIIHADSISVTPIDTTGAGDSFNAGFIYGYLKGWPLERSLRLACICGALSTRVAGGTGSQPTLDEALAFMD